VASVVVGNVAEGNVVVVDARTYNTEDTAVAVVVDTEIY
jgi:hypothetical protein